MLLCPLHITAFVTTISLFQTSYLVHHDNDPGELSLRLDGIFQIELVLNKRPPRHVHVAILIGKSLYVCPPISGLWQVID